MALPEVICIDGTEYIQVDVARVRFAKAGHDPDEWQKVYALGREFGVDVHRIYDAINGGRLPARRPNGASRGWRVRRADFVRWLDTWEAAAAG